MIHSTLWAVAGLDNLSSTMSKRKQEIQMLSNAPALCVLSAKMACSKRRFSKTWGLQSQQRQPLCFGEERGGFVVLEKPGGQKLSEMSMWNCAFPLAQYWFNVNLPFGNLTFHMAVAIIVKQIYIYMYIYIYIIFIKLVNHQTQLSMASSSQAVQWPGPRPGHCRFVSPRSYSMLPTRQPATLCSGCWNMPTWVDTWI